MAAMAQLRIRPRKTVEDYLALPDDVRAELIGGELYVTPSPTLRHQDAVAMIWRLLDGHAVRTGAGRAWVAPADVHLPSGDIVQPDVLFVRGDRMEIARDVVEGAPDLVVEVVSPSNAERDRVVKRDLYATNGVPAYWIVDPGEGTIEVLRLEGAAYAPEGYFEGDRVLATPAFPGLEVPLSRVFR